MTNAAQFHETMSEVHRLFDGGDHQAALQSSHRLQQRLLAGPIVDAEQLGWAVYYRFRCLHALGETNAAWDLLHSDDLALCRIPQDSEAWMWSVGAELAAKQGRAEEVLRCGEACFAHRYASNDHVGQKLCCETVCTLLARLGRVELGRDFARQLVALGREHGAIVAALTGLGFLLDALDAGCEAVRQDVREAVGELGWIDAGDHTEARDRILGHAGKALGESLKADDGSPRRGPVQGPRAYELAPSLETRAFRQAVACRDRSAEVHVSGFRRFAVLMDLQFERVGYSAHQIDDGLMFWITDEHARAIGQCLSPSLRAFHLALTCFAGGGFDLMADAVSADIRLDELVVNHRSADEVTIEEARGLARFASRVRAKRLVLWAAEYDPGALASLAEGLEKTGNQDLVDVEVCDTSLPEPDDQLELPRLTRLVEHNRVGASR